MASETTDTTAETWLQNEDPLAQLEAGPIFVCGHIRSGTTWELDVLGAHPQVANLFESLIFTGNGLGQLLNPAHWSEELQQRAFGRPIGLRQLLTQQEVVADVRRLCDA